MINRQLAKLLVISIIFVLTSCAVAPTQEMSDARQAVQAARDAGAPQNAPQALAQAEKLLITAEQQLTNRTFREARGSAVAAKEQAIDARQLAQAIGAAKTAISKALAVEALSPDITGLLEKAMSLAEKGDKKAALEAAQAAQTRAEQALQAKQKSLESTP